MCSILLNLSEIEGFEPHLESYGWAIQVRKRSIQILIMHRTVFDYLRLFFKCLHRQDTKVPDICRISTIRHARWSIVYIVIGALEKVLGWMGF